MKKLFFGLVFAMMFGFTHGQSSEKSVSIPNVFTPNQDGKNDLFLVTSDNIRSLKARVYNRYGAMVYSWNSLNGGWDGYTFAGEPCPDGTYYYVITYVGNDDAVSEEKGTVTLLR